MLSMFFSYRLIPLRWVVGCLLLLPFGSAGQPAADTLRVDLPRLEEQFLSRNYQLLAQRFQISAAEAEVIQAGLRPNPNLEVSTNLYNPNTGKVLPLSTPSAADINNDVYNSGYFSVQLQQLIQLAGKRSKLVALAESNRALASIAFRDVLRTLRYQLHTSYANLHYDLQAIRLLREEEGRQQRLIESSRIALQTGGIARYELTRLEVDLRDLRANIASYRSQIAEEQATLRVLLRQTSTQFIVPTQVPAALPALNREIAAVGWVRTRARPSSGRSPAASADAGNARTNRPAAGKPVGGGEPVSGPPASGQRPAAGDTNPVPKILYPATPLAAPKWP